jgi:hypothetical protein
MNYEEVENVRAIKRHQIKKVFVDKIKSQHGFMTELDCFEIIHVFNQLYDSDMGSNFSTVRDFNNDKMIDFMWKQIVSYNEPLTYNRSIKESELRAERSNNLDLRADNGMKHCPQCDVTKSVSEFSKHQFSPDGYVYSCKSCKNKNRIDRYAKLKKSRLEVEPPKEQTCRKCKVTKEIDQFYRHPSYSCGFNSVCIKCTIEHVTNNPKKVYEVQKFGEKECRDCRIIKDINMFAVSKSRPNGRVNSCRECQKEKYGKR